MFYYQSCLLYISSMRFLQLIILLFFLACTSEQSNELQSFSVPKSKTLELIAQEPMLNAPVAIDFDEQGRIWVLEMPAYMPNVDGTGEDASINSIKILSDQDGDGTMDSVLVFLDNLVLPRTICLAYGGLIYAEPPFLYHIEIENDKPGKRTVIDSVYAVDGNVEHMPNSITWNMDNWLYSSSANTRYKREGDNWIKEFTTPRGQWGMTKDNYGRLLYNNNSLLLAGDRILPNALFSNPYLRLQENNLNILTDTQAVYPLQATAVNRGYQEGVLNEEEFLINATSACAPVYYRDAFVHDWEESAFVALPEINAIKKLKVNHEGLDISAKASSEKTEYLISSDEGFRPVHLKFGPDGNLYIVDMHRGIIQHKAYMTSYLKDKILNRGLEKVHGQGRIYKLSSADNELRTRAFNVKEDPVSYLYSNNAFLRDKAQHYIVYKNRQDLVPRLKENIFKQLGEVNQLHTLWTLEGLNALTEYELLVLMNTNLVHLRYHAMHILSQRRKIVNKKWLLNNVNQIIKKEEPEADFAVASHLASFRLRGPIRLERDYRNILLRNDTSRIFTEAILADAVGWESQLLQKLVRRNDSTYINLQNGLEDITRLQKSQNPVYYYSENLRLEDRRTVGMDLYNTFCASCHGIDGGGIKSIAPQLANSDFVSGDDTKLILTTLHGLNGPIHVNGKKQSYSNGMVGLHQNPMLNDVDLKDILNYVRNAFNSAPYTITEDKICYLRNYAPSNGQVFTEESLEQMANRVKKELEIIDN